MEISKLINNKNCRVFLSLWLTSDSFLGFTGVLSFCRQSFYSRHSELLYVVNPAVYIPLASLWVSCCLIVEPNATSNWIKPYIYFHFGQNSCYFAVLSSMSDDSWGSAVYNEVLLEHVLPFSGFAWSLQYGLEISLNFSASLHFISKLMVLSHWSLFMVLNCVPFQDTIGIVFSHLLNIAHLQIDLPSSSLELLI